ncbi:amidohydrolase 2 [Polyplosphaeria fusca]|uniref:Amidohydrolase 2 n=1 Tax=Polyplosphaeria fusca TaxID=682080 RepID=A0A9P4UT86_9PLEO|nr:amidohydrolase 2 [Polyplosphaeria fusca]
MPTNGWDTHMHVTDPSYPEAADAEYTPGQHNLSDALSFESTIGINSLVLIQPSIYGNDNTLLLNALTKLGTRHGRGVVGFDTDATSFETLQAWHQLGVRGVRLNIKSNEVNLTEAELQERVTRYAKIIQPLDWVLELYIGMEDIPKLEPVVADLGVRLSIAHFGAPTLPPIGNRTLPLDPYTVAGFQSLVNLLKAGKTYIKFSGAYRFDKDPQYRGIEGIARELLKFAGDRIIFASDWPHTRFEGLDIHPFVEKCLDWTDAAGVTEKVFSRNAHELWDIPLDK